MAHTIFIYRPDQFSSKVKYSCLYTSSGKSFHEWKREQDTIYKYRQSKKIEKAESMPDYKVFDFWRNE